jgi:hypothetical protein
VCNCDEGNGDGNGDSNNVGDGDGNEAGGQQKKLGRDARAMAKAM